MHSTFRSLPFYVHYFANIDCNYFKRWTYSLIWDSHLKKTSSVSVIEGHEQMVAANLFDDDDFTSVITFAIIIAVGGPILNVGPELRWCYNWFGCFGSGRCCRWCLIGC